MTANYCPVCHAAIAERDFPAAPDYGTDCRCYLPVERVQVWPEVERITERSVAAQPSASAPRYAQLSGGQWRRVERGKARGVRLG